MQIWPETAIETEEKFVLTMGGLYITDQRLFCWEKRGTILYYTPYDIVTRGISVSESLSDVPENIRFNTYKEAYEKMLCILTLHTLLRNTKNKANFIGIEPVRYAKVVKEK